MSDSNLMEFDSFDEGAAESARRTIESEGNEFVKVKEGWQTFRILPGLKGSGGPFKEVHQHYIQTPKGAINVVCPRMMTKGKKFCPICEKVEKLRSSGNPIDRDKGYQLRAQLRIFCNVIDRKDPSMKVKVWAFTKGMYDDLTALREDPEDPTDFAHPLEGYDVRVHRKGTKKEDTEYKVKLAKHSGPMIDDGDGEADIDAINATLKSMHKLEKYEALPSDEDIMAALKGKRPDRKALGSGSDDDADEEEEARPRGRARRRASDDADDAIEAEFEENENDDDLPDGY